MNGPSMRAVAGALAALLFTGGCSTAPRWQASHQPNVRDAAAILATDGLTHLRAERPEDVPHVPVRKRLRPCCAFGSGLRVRLGRMKLPGIAIDNMRSPDAIGRHVYDAGQNGTDQVIGSERNGLVYTCRGGFIDIAHVRDYADWTLYLATEFARHLETGATIELPDSEGGMRRFVLEPIDPEFVAIVGRRDLAASLAAWASFQLSVWHEIATWYGWASFDLFSERASAFSPEDLYSNLLGAKLAAAIISGGNDLSEPLFNRAADGWLAQSLAFLGAVPAEAGEEAMASVDQLWWNSEARLPDAGLVLRRSFEIGHRIRPWLVTEHGALEGDIAQSSALAAHCEPDEVAHVLRNPSRLPQLDFDAVVRLEVTLDPERRDHPELQHLNGSVRQSDFDEILQGIQRAARREFGPDAHHPGRADDEAPSVR